MPPFTCKTEERLTSFFSCLKDLAIFQTEKESGTLFSNPPVFLPWIILAKLRKISHISNTIGILFYIFSSIFRVIPVLLQKGIIVSRQEAPENFLDFFQRIHEIAIELV